MSKSTDDAHRKKSKKPYNERTDLEKLEAQWTKLSGLHLREDLLASSGSGQPRDLITSGYIDRIHDERNAIETALGGASIDLMAPAVAWLSAYILNARELAAA